MKELFAALLLLAAPAYAGPQDIVLKTSDGCVLAAWYTPPLEGLPVFVNTHGMGSAKFEWAALHRELEVRGWGWLSLDLRGHGASAACGPKKAGYKAFSSRDWQNASRDVEAAAEWLAAKGVPAGRQFFCGASVGANLSLKASAEGKVKPAGVILLSPGLDYGTVRTEPYLAAAPRLLIAAAPTDQYAWRSSAALVAAAGRLGRQADFVSASSGHGSGMFADSALIPRLLGWAAKK